MLFTTFYGRKKFACMISFLSLSRERVICCFRQSPINMNVVFYDFLFQNVLTVVLFFAAIREESEEAEPKSNIFNGLGELGGNEATSGNTSEHADVNNTPNFSNKEPVITIATPSTSVIDSNKMLTPKRSRALVKPTTLFENGTETDENKIDQLINTKTSANQDVAKESKTTDCFLELPENSPNIEENESISTEEKQNHVTKSCVDEERIDDESVCNTVDSVQETSEEKSSASSNNLDNDVAGCEHIAVESCAEMDFEDAGFEKTFVDLPENQKIEKPDIPVYDVPETEGPEHESIDVCATEKSKQENLEMIIDDVCKTSKLRQENQEMQVECVSVTEELENPEITVTEQGEQENCENSETLVEVVPVPETSEQEASDLPVEENVAVEDTTDSYVKIINDLLTLKSHQELAELPLDTLFLCHEQLMTILSNTTAAIRLKCTPSRN